MKLRLTVLTLAVLLFLTVLPGMTVLRCRMNRRR